MVGVEVTAQTIGQNKNKGRKRKRDDDYEDGDHEPDEGDV